MEELTIRGNKPTYPTLEEKKPLPMGKLVSRYKPSNLKTDPKTGHEKNSFLKASWNFMENIKVSVDNLLQWNFKESLNIWFLQLLDDLEITPNDTVSYRLLLVILWGIISPYSPELWATLITLSAIGDRLDGNLARKTGKMSEIGQSYDAFVDKSSRVMILGVLLWAIENGYIKTALIPIGIVEIIYHIKSQFSPERWTALEQLKSFWEIILKWDKNISYIEKTTSWSANKDWKMKTVLQLSSGIALVWSETGIFDFIVSWFDEETQNIIKMTLQSVCIILNWASLYFAHKSIQWRKK